MSTETVMVEYGYRVLEPVRYTKRIEKRGWFHYYWVQESKYGRLENGPFWSEHSARLDMARYPCG